jgi:hypothetical protein
VQWCRTHCVINGTRPTRFTFQDIIIVFSATQTSIGLVERCSPSRRRPKRPAVGRDATSVEQVRRDYGVGWHTVRVAGADHRRLSHRAARCIASRGRRAGLLSRHQAGHRRRRRRAPPGAEHRPRAPCRHGDPLYGIRRVLRRGAERLTGRLHCRGVGIHLGPIFSVVLNRRVWAPRPPHPAITSLGVSRLPRFTAKSRYS